MTELSLRASGHLRKMVTQLEAPVHYQLPLDDELVDMAPLIGQPIRLEYTGEIHCQHCGRKTRKSFNQGFCYPCFTRLPQCDSCIVKPEKCHYHEGTCRDPSWGERHCFQPHVVYLANSSGIKVGITRGEQVPTRWMDQGAIQALPILEVDTRLHSGLIEQIIAAHVSDKTNWRTMLKGQVEPLDLKAERDRLLTLCALQLDSLREEYGVEAIRELDAEVVEINYPVEVYPAKVGTHNLDKNPVVEGVLQGIKGQYLILDTGVINIRKFAAYNVELSF
ncbi:DUF2797 domain-containing protein [Marinobacterium stanieri]|uniref:DUF2797 domain-containing protein n=1 Tax=Marinobacterium stanieri TaxID=49186 RepID=UPI0002557CEA|nr:DUF2797 domain-containing protein [Marinobacterium stanieri]